MSELVQDVAERLNIPEEEAELVLRALSKLILKQAGRGDAARVPEVGLFRQKEGRLTFTPDEQLSAIVNHRFEGLPPLPALDDDSASAVPADTENEIGPALDASEELDAREEAVPSTEHEANKPLEKEIPAEAAELQEAESQEEATELPDGQEVLAQSVSEVLGADASTEPPASTAEAETTGDASQEESAPDTTAPDKPAEPPRSRKPRRSRSSWPVVALLLVGFLAGGGIWLLMVDQPTENSAEVTNGPDEPLEEAQPLMSEDPIAEETTEDGDADDGNDEAASDTPQEEIDVMADGYTLVLISRRNRNTLEGMLDSFRETYVPMGYPVSVLAPPAGETRYRLGLGQFDDPDEALEAREELEGEIPDDAWVLRLRPEMDPDS